MPRLTANYIETKIELPTQGQVIIRDDALKGFALRLTPGNISYICECRVAGKFRRVTIGRHGQGWTPDTARRQALLILGEMASGIDPVAQKQKRETLSLTLRQAFEEYMDSREICSTPRQVTLRRAHRRVLQQQHSWTESVPMDECAHAALPSNGMVS